MKQTNTNYLCSKNPENPDVVSQREGPEVYIDLFFRKPNKYGLLEIHLSQTLHRKRTNHNDLLLSRSGTKAARAPHLLVFGSQKVAPNLQTPS